MFKKARNRILLLNMLMASSVVLIVFIVIFTTTYSRINNDNRNKLSYASPSMHVIAAEVYGEEPLDEDFSEDGVFTITGMQRLISPYAGLSFFLIVDSRSNVVEANSMLDLDSQYYRVVADRALELNGKTEIIRYEGRVWQYEVTPINIRFFVPIDNGADIFNYFTEYYHIQFLDVTDSHQMLKSLAVTLIALGVIVLFVFYIISRYFATQAIKPMEEAFLKQTRFISDASHELKTPLSIINANCAVLLTNEEDIVKNQLKWIDNIMRSSDRMTGLVNNLLTLASVTESSNTPELISFDLGRLLTLAVSEIEALAIAKQIVIKSDISSDITVTNDRARIAKVLSILLDNAIKYTNNEGEISIALTREKQTVRISIRNTGEGITEENLLHIFDRFYRGDPSRSSDTGGYGLGLTIAKGISDILGAKLSASSVVNDFTEFEFVLKS